MTTRASGYVGRWTLGDSSITMEGVSVETPWIRLADILAAGNAVHDFITVFVKPQNDSSGTSQLFIRIKPETDIETDEGELVALDSFEEGFDGLRQIGVPGSCLIRLTASSGLFKVAITK